MTTFSICIKVLIKPLNLILIQRNPKNNYLPGILHKFRIPLNLKVHK